jgi:hypothetical protein
VARERSVSVIGDFFAGSGADFLRKLRLNHILIIALEEDREN